jgi:glycerophosphoryl diester phosphodiesterase
MLRYAFRFVWRLLVCLIVACTLVIAPNTPLTTANTTPYVRLAARSILPADSFAAGPPAGFALVGGNTNGRQVPFANQPVQGVSAVVPKWNGNFLVLADNGFGAKSNSADFRLRWYEVNPNFGTGQVSVVGYTELTDPNRLVPFPIVNANLDRALTGADFDVESFRQAPDGTFWIGEEFGPYLLHVDVNGRLLDPPFPTPYPAALAPFARGLRFVQSPDHPDLAGLPDANTRIATANLGGSRGFEGMAINPAGTKLYLLLEGPLVEDPIQTRLLIQEFDIREKRYTGNYWFYPISVPGNAIGEITAINDNELLVIERDGGQGASARYKRIYKIDLRTAGASSTVDKTLVVDLMAITDNKGLTTAEPNAVGLGPVFSFPFVTIESVYPIDGRTLLVINDNNYPFSTGRRPGVPDDNEFILLTLPEELKLKR